MKLNTESKNLRQELKAGIHLVTFMDIKKQLDSSKNVIVNDGEIAITVTFATGTNPNAYYEQTYWIGKGNDGKEKYFTKMCVDAGIDMSKTPLDKKDAIGKRLWIAIREVYTLVNDDVKKDILGNDIIEYFIFNTSPLLDPEKPPMIKGDPNKNGGQAMDDFISYKNEGQNGYDVDVVDLNAPVLEVEETTQEDVAIAYMKENKGVLEQVNSNEKTDKNVTKEDIENVIAKASIKKAKITKVKVGNADATKTEFPNGETVTHVNYPPFNEQLPLPNFDGKTSEPPVDFTPHISKEDMTVKPNFEVITSTEKPNFSDDVSPDINFK